MFTKIKEMVNVDQSEVSNVLFELKQSNEKLYESYDYHRFNFVDSNREVDEVKVAKLIKSIREDGYLKSIVIVNEKLDVIDGQHRVRALIELDKQGVRLPLYFMMCPGYGNKEMIMYNKNNHNWTKQNYLEHHVKTGLKSYIALDQFMKDYPEYSLGAALTIFTNMVDNSNGRERTGILINSKLKKEVSSRGSLFENGELEMPENILNVYDMADKIRSFKKFNKDYHYSSFVNAIIMLHKINGFNFKQLMDKINKPRIIATNPIDSLGKSSIYREKINSIYNSNVSITNPNYLELRIIRK
jgi:disulfide oxidoreductase YuzD